MRIPHFVLLASLTGCLSLAPPQDAGVDTADSSIRPLIERYRTDLSGLERRYDVPMSESGAARMRRFHGSWAEQLARVDFDGLAQDERVDYLLLRNDIRHEQKALAHEEQRLMEIDGLVGFRGVIIELAEARRALEPIDSEAIARSLTDLARAIEVHHDRVKDEDAEGAFPPTIAKRGADRVASLARSLRSWYRFYNGYDPLFTWWVEKPYEAVREKLEAYEETIRKKLVHEDDDDFFLGDPIGREALFDELAYEMIPYTPEELIEIAEREFAWCDREMLRASNDLGFGDDWHAALNHVKDLHVGPGEQPELIRSLAIEAIDFLEERDLVTIPELAKETWRMEMMSPARQKVSPYFLGGETIMVSFPTNEMEHADKLMSMRGNNPHFSRATVHHELIPGHHLQGFMRQRYRTYRRPFGTPFWMEGWALYWELHLWDLDFPQSAENRIGMLFWRMHRCARIVFSLSYHLGKMTELEAIDFLVERVGHERNNATAEVRRSVAGGYGPLYQCAYMLGGLQLRALHAELVTNGDMTEKQFHDAVLQQNSIPIEFIRAALGGHELTPDYETTWRF